MRYWERVLFTELHAFQPARRLWANVLADALYTIYRIRHSKAVTRDLAWLLADDTGSLLRFADLAIIFDIDPADVRRDVLRDIAEGNTKTRPNHGIN